MFLYKITNNINGKIYFGVTVRTVENRWIRHKSSANTGSQLSLHRAMRKYGFDAFTITEIASFTNTSDMKQAEIQHIALFESNDPTKGYNNTKGGDGTWGRTHTPDVRQRIKDGVGRAIREGRMFTEEWFEKMRADRATRRGVPLSEQHRSNISKALTGKQKNHNSGRQPIPVDQFTKTGEYVQTFACYGDAARSLNVDSTSIMRCCQGKQKSVKGYVFKYATKKS